jgi:hypothetical protein
MPARRIASLITITPRSVAETELSEPAKSPIAVLHALTITTSLINLPLSESDNLYLFGKNEN